MQNEYDIASEMVLPYRGRLGHRKVGLQTTRKLLYAKTGRSDVHSWSNKWIQPENVVRSAAFADGSPLSTIKYALEWVKRPQSGCSMIYVVFQATAPWWPSALRV